MQFSTRKTGEVVIADLGGRLTADDGARVLYSQVKKILQAGTISIIINMAGLEMMDSSGLGELVRINRELGGQLKLLNVGINEKRTFDLANLSRTFEFYTSEKAAVDSF